MRIKNSNNNINLSLIGDGAIVKIKNSKKTQNEKKDCRQKKRESWPKLAKTNQIRETKGNYEKLGMYVRELSWLGWQILVCNIKVLLPVFASV